LTDFRKETFHLSERSFNKFFDIKADFNETLQKREKCLFSNILGNFANPKQKEA
jgi:hypothetical protein